MSLYCRLHFYRGVSFIFCRRFNFMSNEKLYRNAQFVFNLNFSINMFLPNKERKKERKKRRKNYRKKLLTKISSLYLATVYRIYSIKNGGFSLKTIRKNLDPSYTFPNQSKNLDSSYKTMVYFPIQFQILSRLILYIPKKESQNLEPSYKTVVFYPIQCQISRSILYSPKTSRNLDTSYKTDLDF